MLRCEDIRFLLASLFVNDFFGRRLILMRLRRLYVQWQKRYFYRFLCLLNEFFHMSKLEVARCNCRLDCRFSQRKSQTINPSTDSGTIYLVQVEIWILTRQRNSIDLKGSFSFSLRSGELVKWHLQAWPGFVKDSTQLTTFFLDAKVEFFLNNISWFDKYGDCPIAIRFEDMSLWFKSLLKGQLRSKKTIGVL